MTKYIIKNCPCCQYDNYCIGSDELYPKKCQNIADCLLKHIVRKCKIVAYAGQCDNCDGCGYDNGCVDTECGTYQANEILQLMEIEEV